MISLFGTELGFMLPSAFFAAIALGGSLLVYAYLRKGKSTKIAVASTMFLKFLETIPRSRQKFLPPWRFFLELLLLLLLASAAAGLYAARSGNKVVILLDNSASMQAIADNSVERKSLFNSAVDKVRSEFITAGWNSKYNIYVTSPVLTSLTDGYVGGEKASSSLNNAKVSNFKDNLQASVEKLYQSKDFYKLMVVSDKVLNKESVRSDDLTWYNLKSASDTSRFSNLALTNMRFNQSAMSDEGSSLDLSLQSFSSEPMEARVKLSACAGFEACKNPHFQAERAVSLKPNSSASINFPSLGAGDFAFYAEITDIKKSGRSFNDALDVDNKAWITSNSVKSKVLLVSELSSESLGLNLIPTLDIIKVSPATYAATLSSGTIKQYSSVIFHRYVPETLPDLNVIFVRPPDNRFFTVGGIVANVQVSRWKTGHALLSYLNLSTLKFNELTPLKIPEVLEPLIYTPAGVAAFVTELNGRRMTGFGFEMFPYEGRRSPLLSVLTLNVFKWISEISSESGFQRLDYPLQLNPQIESILSSDGKRVYQKAPETDQSKIYLENASLLQIKPVSGAVSYQAFRFYNPEESNTFDVQEVKAAVQAAGKSDPGQLGDTLTSSLVSLVLVLLLLDLIFQLVKLFRGKSRRASYAN